MSNGTHWRQSIVPGMVGLRVADGWETDQHNCFIVRDHETDLWRVAYAGKGEENACPDYIKGFRDAFSSTDEAMRFADELYQSKSG